MSRFLLFPFALLLVCNIGHSQGVRIGNTLVVSQPTLNKSVNPDAFQSFIVKEILPALNEENQELSFNLFRGDRGNLKGAFLLVGTTGKIEKPEAAHIKSPLSIAETKGIQRINEFVSDPETFTEYRLVGWEEIKSLPTSGILGIHSIQVKKERAKQFEEFVADKLHPAVSQLLPDMQLLYFKAVGGENVGSYITIFTIDSPEARDKYWPGGTSETEILKKTFKPLEGLARELETYLVEDSYLEPQSGGAAAYWESKIWTDYILMHPTK
ncbi:MAG TPA: hypothetical protein VE467_04645 [Chryseolinea sp.]|nr:hypothetical protein [Chryseolinea sp.]